MAQQVEPSGHEKQGTRWTNAEKKKRLSAPLARASQAAAAASASSSKAHTGKPGLQEVSVQELAVRKPIALLTLVPRDVSMLFAGAIAGATAKTATAPLDRLKILMQVSTANQDMAASAAARSGGLGAAFFEVGKSEGLLGYWRGNLPQVVRVLPYSALQLFTYDKLKKTFARTDDGSLPVPARLAAGALAAIISTTITYPLDIMRLRLATDPNVTTMAGVLTSVVRNEGPQALYKGVFASWAGIAPYSALNFCAFDLFKKAIPEKHRSNPTSTVVASLLGAAFATTLCFPLDTIRRQMQLQSSAYANIFQAFAAILQRDGVAGFYRGFVPNALKNLPNQSIRLSTFDAAKSLLNKAEAARDSVARSTVSEKLPSTKSSASPRPQPARAAEK